jgi:hypothetical protein
MSDAEVKTAVEGEAPSAEELKAQKRPAEVCYVNFLSRYNVTFAVVLISLNHVIGRMSITVYDFIIRSLVAVVFSAYSLILALKY